MVSHRRRGTARLSTSLRIRVSDATNGPNQNKQFYGIVDWKKIWSFACSVERIGIPLSLAIPSRQREAQPRRERLDCTVERRMWPRRNSFACVSECESVPVRSAPPPSCRADRGRKGQLCPRIRPTQVATTDKVVRRAARSTVATEGPKYPERSGCDRGGVLIRRYPNQLLLPFPWLEPTTVHRLSPFQRNATPVTCSSRHHPRCFPPLLVAGVWSFERTERD